MATRTRHGENEVAPVVGPGSAGYEEAVLAIGRAQVEIPQQSSIGRADLDATLGDGGSDTGDDGLQPTGRREMGLRLIGSGLRRDAKERCNDE
jgi:hypothetical protein